MSAAEQSHAVLQRRLDQAEEEIANLKVALDRAIASRDDAALDAERQAENARRATEETQHFVYAVSHDLRQPLRGVMTSAQLLERQADIKPRIESFTSDIIQGAIEMNALLERILTFSRVASNLRRSIVPLTAVVQWTLMNMGKAITDANAQITCGDLPTVDVDDSTVAMLFQELFTNSILYHGSELPKIHVTSDEADSGYVISVQDNGVGIEKDFHEKVFAPFQKLQKHPAKGFGLGLSISRKIVRAHGGSIWLESDGATGSTVRFTIPN